MTIHTSSYKRKMPYTTYERSGFHVCVLLIVFYFVDVFYIHTIHTDTVTWHRNYIVIYATTSWLHLSTMAVAHLQIRENISALPRSPVFDLFAFLLFEYCNMFF